MDRDKIIDGLRMTMDLFTFDPTTGEEKDPDDLNDLDRATYDACKGALEILERLDTDSDTISRQAAIEALKNDMASLDHIIKGMSANDVRLDAYVSQRNQVNYDIYAIEQLPPAQPQHIRGHWICDRSWSEGVGMGESYGRYWKCDKCGHLEKSNGGVCGCNFCSNCGSDNREVTT